MFTLSNIQTRRCSRPSMECWPCTFTQLWFHDMPFLLIPDLETDATSLVRRLYCTIRSFIERNILGLLKSRLCISVVIRMRQLNKEIFRSTVSTKSVVYLKKRPTFPISMCRKKERPPASLSSIPAEIRLKIFDYVTSGTTMNVVGYWNEGQDAFYFKERGKFMLDSSQSALQRSLSSELLSRD